MKVTLTLFRDKRLRDYVLTKSFQDDTLGAPHRPIAFSFHKSLLFLVNFFQDDTLGAPCKALSISDLTVFRVEQTATLKMIKTLVFRELRAAPKPKSKAKNASIRNRGDAYGDAYLSARHPSPCLSQLLPPHPTIATTPLQQSCNLWDQCNVCGEPGYGIELVCGEPAGGLVLEKVRTATGNRTGITFHGEVESRVIVLDGIDMVTDIDLNLQLLTDLTAERFLRALPRLNLAARETPSRP